MIQWWGAELADRGDEAHLYRNSRRKHPMTIHLDHTVVPAHDKEASARFFARIFGLEYTGPVSHFAPVRINEQLTIDFDNWEKFERHHYAFKVGEAEFDGIYDRVLKEGITYGSGPRSHEDMTINHRHGGRGFYFCDPNGHLLEVLTA
jgi:catechol 2,3-dioxygenase-like lactoylglutathione lyase family enzyme